MKTAALRCLLLGAGIFAIQARAQDSVVPATEQESVDSEDVTEQWTEMSFNLESAHPYSVDDPTSIPVKIDGAKRLKFFFTRIDVEVDYDYLNLYDGAGNKVQRFAGSQSNVTSRVLEGDSALIEIEQDDSGNAWGFKITKIFAQF